MRSPDIQEVALYSYVSPEQRLPADHPLRPIREMVNGVLHTLSPEFDKIYSIYNVVTFAYNLLACDETR